MSNYGTLTCYESGDRSARPYTVLSRLTLDLIASRIAIGTVSGRSRAREFPHSTLLLRVDPRAAGSLPEECAPANHPQCPFVDSVRLFQREGWLVQPLEDPLHVGQPWQVDSEPSIAYLPCGSLRLSNDVPRNSAPGPRARLWKFREAARGIVPVCAPRRGQFATSC